MLNSIICSFINTTNSQLSDIEIPFSPSGYVCVRHNDSGKPGIQSTTSKQNGALKNLIENYSDIPDGAMSVIGVISNEK